MHHKKITLRKRERSRAQLRKNETKMVKTNDKMKPIEAKANEKTLIIAQEIKVARLLANNDKRIRDKVLKRLKKWLTARSQSTFAFTKTNFMSLWKGLFFSMWLSDKMLIQEELAESLSNLVHCFSSMDTIVLYTSCALETIGIEWFGIDQYRLDKFSMLVRRILRQTFVVCRDKSWDMEWVINISQIFEKLFLYPKIGLGFRLHITDIYLEELAKVSGGNLSKDAIYEFIKPFVIYLITTNDERQMKHIMRHIFRYLIFQSDVGLDYMEKFNAWKKAGFPCAHVDDMQKIEISDTEETFDNKNERLSKTEMQNEIKKNLDLRAGRVDVELPQISFDAAKIAELLLQYRFHSSSTSKSRRQLLRLVAEYKELSKGEMPLGIKKIRKPNVQKKDMNSKKAALDLIQFEKNLLSDKMSKKQNRKRKKESIEAAVCHESFLDSSKDGDISNLNFDTSVNTADLKNKSVDTPVKSILQDTDANIVPFKKQKKSNLMYHKQNDTYNKRSITENKEKLGIKSCEASQAKQFKKLKQMDDTYMAGKNVKHKAKKVSCEAQIYGNVDQSTSASIVSKKKSSSKGTENNSIIKEAISDNNVLRNGKETPLKNKVSIQVKIQTNSDNSSAKKKVVFRLIRNTEQRKSEYLQQVRKSPAIPFDANKKPLASVLKNNPIPSPFNPFYKKKCIV